MDIEIDQSGRIEETHRDTILAFSNGVSYSIKIHRRTKRRLLEEFRKQGKPKLFTLRTFSAGIFLLIKNFIPKLDSIVIDVEYYGRDRTILEMIEEMVESTGHPHRKSGFRINFQQIGKKSKAHLLAISVYRGKQKPNRIIQFSELVKLAIKKSR